MKKIITLCLLASAVIMAQAKVYTLAELAEVVGTIENSYVSGEETITETVGIAAEGNVYTIMLPTALAEGVTGIGFDDNNIVLTKSHFTIVEGNDLTINPNETLLFAGAAQLEMSGTLNATGALFAAAEGSEATAKGLRFIGDNAMADFEGCTFEKVNVNFGSTNGYLIAKNCNFNEQTSKGGNSAINFTSSCTGNVIENCNFVDNELASVASGANAGVGATIKNCTFTKSFTSSRLYPAINMSVNSNDMVIEGNSVSGPAVNTRAGGIAVSNLIGNSTAGTIYVTGNTVQDCSYGITLTGGGNIRIVDNIVKNNRYIANVNQGGSGINITCNSASAMANAYLRGNHIEGNAWGVTVVGSTSVVNTNVNAGCLEPGEDMEYNPGENVFVNNGNGDVLYDWYNNTLATSYAQGNQWNVDAQDAEHIEQVIVHQADIASLGEVIYMPAYEEPNTINELYLVGTFNGWNQTEEGGRLAFELNESGEFEVSNFFELNEEGYTEFKLITPNEDGSWRWFGGVDDNQVGYFLVTSELLDNSITLVDGANFRITEEGNYKIKVMTSPERGRASVDGVIEPLVMVITKSEPTAITDVESVVNGDNRYYNIMGQPVANPTSGIYIHNGKKVVVK